MGRPAVFRTLEQRQELKRLLESGMKKKYIAEHFGCDYGVIIRELRRGDINDLTTGPYDPELAQIRYEALSDETKVFDTEKKIDALAACLKADLSFDQIGRFFNCTVDTVRNTIIREYIKLYNENKQKKLM